VPQSFKEWQWADYFPDDNKKSLAYQRLMTSLKLRAGRTGSRSYRVKCNHLNMREKPGTKHKKVGQISSGEIVERLDANEDESWIRVRRNDDLIGWCVAEYLSEVVHKK
jgi:uncharacterized protein YgiM (DUF1202 family)